MIVIFTCLGRMVERYDVRRTDVYVILTVSKNVYEILSTLGLLVCRYQPQAMNEVAQSMKIISQSM
jgi:hypothetical protein